MKRTATILLVAGVGILAALAVADALRPAPPAREATPPTTTQTKPVGLSEVLRRERVTGFVLYSDADCRLHSLSLPQLSDDLVRQVHGAAVRQCSIGASGGRVLADDQVASPDLRSIAACHLTQVVVRDWATGALERRLGGCPFAWRPDGELTRFVRGRIVSDDRVLYSRSELREAARTHPSVMTALHGHDFHVFVNDFAWLGEHRLVAALDIEPVGSDAPLFLAALFDGRTLTGIATTHLGPFDGWIVSPLGTYAAAANGTIVARDGRATDPPGLPPGQAVAFSPDERWLAYTTGSSIFLVGTPLSDERDRLIQIPKPALDLVWEPITSGTSQPLGS